MLVTLNLNHVWLIGWLAALGTFPVVLFRDVQYVPCVGSRALCTRFPACNGLWILITYWAGGW